MNAGSPPSLSVATLYKTALHHSANAIALCEAVRNHEGHIIDFRYLFINHRYEEFARRPAEAVEGQLATVLFPNALATGIWQRAAEVVITGQQHQQELYYTTNAGHTGWFDVTISRWDDRGVVISFMEVSDQKARILAGQQQAELLSQVICNSLNGILVLESIRDESGKIVDFRCLMANPATRMLNGYTSDDFIRSSFLTLFPATRHVLFPDFDTTGPPQSIFERYVDIVTSGQPIIFDVYYPHDGLTGWYWTAVSKLNDGLILTFLDISDLKHTQQQLEQNVSQLKQTNQNLEQFAYVASHDLQEPLRKITTFGSLLYDRLGEDADAGVRDTVQRMQNSAQRMQALVRDLLEYSRLTARREGFGLVVLNDLVAEVLIDLQPLVVQKQAVIDLSPLPTLPGNAAQLHQLFFCVLNNALKFHQPSTPPQLTVSVTVVAPADLPPAITPSNRSFVAIAVADNGIGFDEKYLDRIFVIFQRLHGRSQYEGTGIGLAIARKVTENHGGALTARSTPGQGSVFTIWLPLDLER